MKKIFSILLLFCTIQTIVAQISRTTDGMLVYYMPKNILIFDIEYEEKIEQRGQFYQYSERYLGTKDIITTNKTTYTLQNISLHTQTHADETRAYTVPFNAKYPLCSLLTLTKQGILAGVNIEPTGIQTSPKKVSKPKSEKTTTQNGLLMPLLEEQLIANSTAKMAEGTARQIYRIRETRLNLLAGETEHVPTDGKAMQLTLAELNHQEQMLTELFIGHTTTRTLHKRIVYIPEQDIENEVLFRFSTHQGPVEKEDLSGIPYYLDITIHRQEEGEDHATNKQTSTLSPIYYNIPGYANVLLSDAEQTWIEKTIVLPQAGRAIALPLSMFQKNTRIVFNPQTGAIQSITQ